MFATLASTPIPQKQTKLIKIKLSKSFGIDEKLVQKRVNIVREPMNNGQNIPITLRKGKR